MRLPIQKDMREIFLRALKQSFRVSFMIIKIYIPLSLLTIILKRLGVIDFIAPLFAPIMELMGLPGETAITLIAGFTNSVYAALGTMTVFDLTPGQVTILGIVIGIAHNLVVETGVLIKLKMANIRIAFFRIFTAFIVGIVLNLLLPQNISGITLNPYNKAEVEVFSWLKSLQGIAITAVQIIVIISVVVIGYEILASRQYPDKLKQKVKLISMAMGFSERALGPWVIGFLVGIAYGAGILFNFAEKHKLTHKDLCLTTIFLCLAHAIIEDPVLFVVLGGNLGWIILTRVLLAVIVVRVLAINGFYKRVLWIGLPLGEKNT